MGRRGPRPTVSRPSHLKNPVALIVMGVTGYVRATFELYGPVTSIFAGRLRNWLARTHQSGYSSDRREAAMDAEIRDSKIAKQVAPLPESRASKQPFLASSAASVSLIEGWIRQAGSSRSLPSAPYQCAAEAASSN